MNKYWFAGKPGLVAGFAAAVAVAFMVASPVMAVERSLFEGRTLVVLSRLGKLVLNFGADGTLSGNAGAASPPSDRGRWWVKDSQMCVQWQNWLAAAAHCFGVVVVDASVLHWQGDDGEVGTAQFTGSGLRRQ